MQQKLLIVNNEASSEVNTWSINLSVKNKNQN